MAISLEKERERERKRERGREKGRGGEREVMIQIIKTEI
jgi:hypothetical protein